MGLYHLHPWWAFFLQLNLSGKTEIVSEVLLNPVELLVEIKYSRRKKESQTERRGKKMF